MLFGYPIVATSNNWLHDCLVETVKNVHAAVDASKRCPAWPKALPTAHRATLKARTGLKDRLKKYNTAVRKLSKADRDAVLEALEAQNRIADLLSGTSHCKVVDDLHADVRDPVNDLFEFAFGLLTDLGRDTTTGALSVRDAHYKAIYDAAADHVCPFCGVEYFDAPGAPREALDHYLARSRYPFAAANLRNLVPMGHKCNSSYKLAADVLYDTSGTRRVAFDPYNHATTINVLLDDSDPFEGTTSNTPKWVIKFDPDSPATQTWDDVFSVRDRYKRDHLDAKYVRWLDLFRDSARRLKWSVATDDERRDAIGKFEELWQAQGFDGEGFLKAGVFRMLRLHLTSGDQRLKDQIRDLFASSGNATSSAGTL